jgi:hypothetical protein
VPGQVAQRPTLIILQSEGDLATKILFPAFRRVTTVFSSSRDAAQSEAIVHGVGWTDRYVTHRLDLDAAFKPGCVTTIPHGCFGHKILAEQDWRLEQFKTHYNGLGLPQLPLSNGLTLSQCRVNDKSTLLCANVPEYASLIPDPGGLARPAFVPIWVIRTDKKIIKDHNDFLNTHLVDFLRQIYYMVLVE